MKIVYSSVAAVFMLYFPYVWCHFRKESTSVYGLQWYADRKSIEFTLLLTCAVLVLLTPAALLWPGVSLPFRRSGTEIFNMFCAGLAAAVIEETFFRGFLQTIFKRRFNLFFAVICVNVLFAASHLVAVRNFWLLATFFPGLVMSFLREKYGNVLPGIVFHFLGNIWAIWFFPL